MNKVYAVITGDLVDSTKLTIPQREKTLSLLTSFPHVVNSIATCQIEIFRGDSFQIQIDNVVNSLRLAVILRALLRSTKMDDKRCIDARLALGIGSIDFVTNSLLTCDGEAFRLSGRLLDDIGNARLKISTFNKAVNDELMISTAFADNIISGWTQPQSNAISQLLINGMTHAELAECLDVSRQMVSKYLTAAKFNLIEMYMKRFTTLSQNLI